MTRFEFTKGNRVMDINGYITIFSNLTILIGVYVAYHFQRRQIVTLNTEVQSKNRIITDFERFTKLISMDNVESIVGRSRYRGEN